MRSNLGGALLLFTAACAPSGQTASTVMPADPPKRPIASASGSAAVVEIPKKPSGVEYLVLAPRAFAEEVQPLLELRRSQGLNVKLTAVEDVFTARSNGKADAEALRAEVASLPDVRFVVLAGDPARGPSTVPSFFAQIGDWLPPGFVHRPHRTDHGYETANASHPVAVGRLPARTEAEITNMVTKLVRYEALASGGAWQRRVLVFGDPANFGAMADDALESHATSLLDELLPYDYDVGVVFAKADSPYVYRYDKLGAKIIDELNAGSLLAVYAGHGLEDSFDSAPYRDHRYMVGSAKDLGALDVMGGGAPIFVSLTCLTGDYGRASGERSIAETMILHPKGPVAVFAASDISHPYANLLFAESLLDSFILKRSPTIGEAITGAKASMLASSIPLALLLVPGDHDAIKREHLTLYNLLGDPASKVRLPAHATVAIDQAEVAPRDTIEVRITSPEVVRGASLVTIETERATLKDGMVASSKIAAMPLESAFKAMASNHAIASDKVVERVKRDLVDGSMTLSVKAPSAPGRYIVKVLIDGGEGIASGHVRFTVGEGVH